MMKWLKRLVERRPVVPLVRLSGMIGSGGALGRGGLSIAGVGRLLEQAFAARGAVAVAIVVNSPGGAPVQSGLIAEKIRELATRRKLPVLAFAEDVAASGGYWLLTAGDELFAHDCSIVGSIGVVSAGFGFTEAIARLGIERRVHTRGTNKALLDPFRPERPEDLALLDELQDDIHAAFIRQVRERRGAKLKGDEADLFSGRIWTGARAVELGLVDGLGTPDSVLRARYGEKLRIRTFGMPRPLLRRLLRLDLLLRGVLHDLDERMAFARYGL